MGGVTRTIRKVVNPITDLARSIGGIFGIGRQPEAEIPSLPQLPEEVTATPKQSIVDQAKQSLMNAERSRKKQGRRALFLTSQKGDETQVQTATKTLLGGD